MAEHYEPHFNAAGNCQCDCENCHLPLTEACICPACPCDDEENLEAHQ